MYLKNATKEEKEYFVFAVLRNPMEIAITVYEKMRTNAGLYKKRGNTGSL